MHQQHVPEAAVSPDHDPLDGFPPKTWQLVRGKFRQDQPTDPDQISRASATDENSYSFPELPMPEWASQLPAYSQVSAFPSPLSFSTPQQP